MLLIGAKRAALSSPVWTPRRNWPSASTPGWGLDPGNFSNLFQDSAGVTQFTALEQPCGLTLDNRFGLARGPEIVINGTFTNNSSEGWTLVTGATVTGEKLQLNVPSANVIATGYTVQVGRSYEWGVKVSGYTSGNVVVNFGGATVATINTNAAYRGIRVNATSTAAIRILSTGSPVASADDFSVRELPGNHFAQASAPARPIIKILDGVQCHSFDGLDDIITTGTTTFGASMDIILAVRRTSATGALLFATAGGAQYVGAMDATAGAASAGAGTPTYRVNDVEVAGGAAATRAQLAAAIPIGQWCVVEILGADMSTWTASAFGAYTALPAGFGLAQAICCPAGDETTRSRNRRFVGLKAGIAL